MSPKRAKKSKPTAKPAKKSSAKSKSARSKATKSTKSKSAKPKTTTATKSAKPKSATATATKSAKPKSAKASKSAKPKSAKPKAAKAKSAKPKAAKSAKPKAAKAAKPSSPAGWLEFVENNGVVLASARGPVPNIAETVAGEPIVGSWWAHPRSKEIFDVLSVIDDSPDVRTFKLVDGKVTFVHRRVWAPLVRLVNDGVIAPERAAAVAQEHTDSGVHHNIVTPFPEWVPSDIATSAESLSTDEARDSFAFSFD